MSCRRYINVLLIAVLSVALFPVRAQASGGRWYVLPIGRDTNDCLAPNSACATIQAALTKAKDGDTIYIGVGTYTGTDWAVLNIENSVNLLAGWDAAFQTQTGLSIIDGQNQRMGVYINEALSVTLSHFIIQNGLGQFTFLSGGITNSGDLTIEYSLIQKNKTLPDGAGGGILNLWNNSGSIWINNSAVIYNEAFTGGGISNEGSNLYINNSTIGHNIARSAGGGVSNQIGSRSVSIANSTIAENEGGNSGGGIYGANFTVENSIIANNRADVSPDCTDLISKGYVLVGDITSCNIGFSTGDQFNVNPALTALGNYGGLTPTFALYSFSPAIDAGKPQNCSVSIDQLGRIRPLDGNGDGKAVCDMGAYEFNWQQPPPQPLDLNRYVKPDGNDQNNCQTPQSACASIQKAILTAKDGGVIYVSSGTYTGAGDQVLLINKNITISGGWDSAFNLQTGVSIIDGQDRRRAVFVSEQNVVRLEKLLIRRGWSGADGGGIYLSRRARVTLRALIIQQNYCYGDGGAIRVPNDASLFLDETVVEDNTAGRSGGAIYSDGVITIHRSTIQRNTANGSGGGIYVGDSAQGDLRITDSKVIANKSLDPNGFGGGISFRMGYAVIQNSIVSDNAAVGKGGGIFAHTIAINDSTFKYNRSAEGGAVLMKGGVAVDNSVFSNNWSTGNGGAFGGGEAVYGGTLTVNNSLMARNFAYGRGGGICSYHGAILSSVSVIKNKALVASGGVDHKVHTAGPYSFSNTLIAENSAPLGPNCAGAFTSQNYNLIDNTAGCSFTISTGDKINLNAGLLSEKMFIPDSPVIDGGNPMGCFNSDGAVLQNDLARNPRLIDGNGDGQAICDIGAYEYNPRNVMFSLYLPIIANQTNFELTDRFNDIFSGWPVLKQDSRISAGYDLPDIYKITLNQPNDRILIPSPFDTVQNFSLGIDGNSLPSTVQGNRYGLVFGLSPDKASFYSFEINQEDQTFYLIHVQPEGERVLIANKPSQWIKTGTEWNNLRVTVLASNVFLEINGIQVGSWQEPTPFPQGATGIIVRTTHMYPAFVKFDNFYLQMR